MDGWVNHYGGLVFLFGAALLLFGRAGAKNDEMAAYIGHAITALAALIAVGIGLLEGPGVLWVAGAAVFVLDVGFLVRRIRHE